MPAEFLTDGEAPAYGRYAATPSQADLERVLFLDDEDRTLVDQHRPAAGRGTSPAWGYSRPNGADLATVTGVRQRTGKPTATKAPGPTASEPPRQPAILRLE